MTRLHEGCDYQLYKIYAWGGLFALVIHIFVSLLVFDVDSQPDLALYVVVGPITLWVLGILAYWWWVLLFKGNRELKELARGRAEGTPAISALKSWSTLHRAMALCGGDAGEMSKVERAARRPVLVFFGMENLLVLWVVGGFWIGNLFLEDSPRWTIGVWAFGVPVLAILMFVGTFLLVGRTSKSAEAAYLAPLGLRLAEFPSLKLHQPGPFGGGQEVIPEGAAVVEGIRHGRRVHIETFGKHSYTLVQAAMPPFTIRSQDGKLVADTGAPTPVTEALKGLREAKRWKGIEVAGGPDGIGVERQSTGHNMWLYDLWLIERVLEKWIESGELVA